MSLLIQNSDDKIKSIARQVFDRHFEKDPKMDMEYDDRQKRLMYNDIIYNMGYLYAAMEWDDDKIFIEYAVWIYQFLCHLIKNISRERMKDQTVLHYRILNEVLVESLSDEEAEKATHHLNNAIKATENEAKNFDVPNRFSSGSFVDIKQKYLELLLNNDTKGAIELINSVGKSGLRLDAIYVEILQEVMIEVGNLWHQHVITVDKEHYCTATTQTVLAQFYPIIFNKPRNKLGILVCCVGNELHEMGARMLSDLFEYHGWESIYLGASVPKDAILHAVGEHQPDLIALSVTMPQYLSLCREIVNTMKNRYPNTKIAVGGRAFQMTDELWKKWDVDISSENAAQLVEWANQNVIERED